jgi:glutamate/tyrosine decarboxylase-like PLP-dependent enzyme
MRTTDDHPCPPLDLDAATRRRLWEQVTGALDRYVVDVRSMAVAPRCGPADVRRALEDLSPDAPLAPEQAVRLVIACMRDQQVHAAHPGYFGLFVPAPAAIGVVAEALAAGFNPQLASWSHAPFGVEAEQWVIRVASKRLGFSQPVEGTITTGGSEANLTSLLVALQHFFPQITTEGLNGLSPWPSMYVSTEAHHSWRKAARIAGLGDRAVRSVPCDQDFRMDVHALRRLLSEDRQHGFSPFMVVATVGTTACGAIDPLGELRSIAASEDLWLHADAAWGGAAALSERHRHVVAGLSDADSVTLDAHKWLSVPMGAGLFFSRHGGGLRAVFATNPHYLPTPPTGDSVTEPFQESIQWSRRFSGLKIFLLLMTSGWAGVADAIDSCFVLGATLKGALEARGWLVVNRTPLPVACFRDENAPVATPGHHAAIVGRVNNRGTSWISPAHLDGIGEVIRACVCNYRTTSRDIDTLIDELDEGRRREREHRSLARERLEGRG